MIEFTSDCESPFSMEILSNSSPLTCAGREHEASIRNSKTKKESKSSLKGQEFLVVMKFEVLDLISSRLNHGQCKLELYSCPLSLLAQRKWTERKGVEIATHGNWEAGYLFRDSGL